MTIDKGAFIGKRDTKPKRSIPILLITLTGGNGFVGGFLRPLPPYNDYMPRAAACPFCFLLTKTG
jgi:hypothetical protein